MKTFYIINFMYTQDSWEMAIIVQMLTNVIRTMADAVQVHRFSASTRGLATFNSVRLIYTVSYVLGILPL